MKPGGMNSGVAWIIVQVEQNMVGANTCGREAIDDTAEGFGVQCRVLAVLRHLMFEPDGDGVYRGAAGSVDVGLLPGTCRYLPMVEFGQCTGISSERVLHLVAVDGRQEKLGGG